EPPVERLCVRGGVARDEPVRAVCEEVPREDVALLREGRQDRAALVQQRGESRERSREDEEEDGAPRAHQGRKPSASTIALPWPPSPSSVQARATMPVTSGG